MTENKKKSLKQLAKDVLEMATEYGLEQNYFFETTFKRYQVQISILDDLEETIKKEGTLVTKEYVKGRGNVYTHPAIGEYNKTATAANQTVTTLIKIIASLRDKKEGDSDPLLDYLG